MLVSVRVVARHVAHDHRTATGRRALQSAQLLARVATYIPVAGSVSYMYFLFGPAFHGAGYLTPEATIIWIKSS